MPAALKAGASTLKADVFLLAAEGRGVHILPLLLFEAGFPHIEFQEPCFMAFRMHDDTSGLQKRKNSSV